MTREPGTKFLVKDTVKNRGRVRAAKSRTRFYLSSNRRRNGGDISVGTRRVPRLAPGATDAGNKRVTIPTDAPPDDYFVIACADARKSVDESREKNNCKTSDSKIQVVPADTTPPPPPEIEESVPSFNSPQDDDEPSFMGSAEAGSTVQLYTTDDCSGPVEASGSSQTFTTSGITVEVADNDETTLTATATDSASNKSECSQGVTYIHDSVAPEAPSDLGATPSFGEPHNDNNPEISGNAPDGDDVTVLIFDNGDCSGASAASGSPEQFEGEGITLEVEGDTVTTVTAATADAAGNRSPCTSAKTYIEDSSPPDTPQIEGSTPDFNIPRNDNDPEFFGSADADSTVTLFKSNNCSGPPAASDDASVFSDPGITVNVPNDSPTEVTASARDEAGNESGCSSSITYEEDSTPPDVPEIEGSSPSLATPQNDNDPEIFGVAPEDAVAINLYPNGVCSDSPIATGTPQDFEGSGITMNVADDSTTTISATATDATGNETACSASVTYIEDSTPPDASQIEGSTPSSASPRNDNDPEFFGSAPVDTLVRLYTTADCSGEPAATGTAATFDDPGITVPLEDNTTTTVRSTAGDEAGNESACSAGVTYTESSPIPFEVEPNDTSATPNVMEGMTPQVRGSISPKGDHDFFSIEVPAGGSVVAETFDTSGTGCSEIDTELTLLGPDGTSTVAFDDDDGTASCSKIDGTGADAAARDLEPGTYLLSVNSWQDQEPIGIYQLDVSISGTPLELEPNDSSATATTLSTRYARGAIQPVGDKDFYSFEVPDGGTVIAETFDSSGTGCEGRDPLIRLIAQDGTTELASDDNSGIGSCSLIDGTGPHSGARGLEGGTYYLSVEDAGNNSPIKGYVVKIETRVGSSNEVEPNDQISEADARSTDPAPVELTSDDRIAGSIEPFGDKDFFQVDLPSPSVVRFETFDASGSDCNAGQTMTLRRYDAAGVQTHSDSSSGINACAALVVPLPAGVSYIGVEETGNDATIADYVLEMDVLDAIGDEAEPNETREQATEATGASFAIAGQHQVQNDVDFFAIAIPEGGASVRAEIVEAAGGETCESGGVDALLTLYGPSGEFLVNDDDDGRSLCSQVDGTGSAPKDAAAHDLAPGTYYLAVEACPSPACQIGGRGQFDYRLAVTIR